MQQRSIFIANTVYLSFLLYGINRPQFIICEISIMIVCIMCSTMSLIITLLYKQPSFNTYIHTFGCNMPMVLI
ncbi:hypothetical protein ACTQ34_13235 [Agathobaculum sp. LCP25S3_E8]|uniref:hypothetical protein n=1 Tax=Agathobaculum sp. LCP25S3_E8 TaxID=3438735 RepID=UPI003F91058C